MSQRFGDRRVRGAWVPPPPPAPYWVTVPQITFNADVPDPWTEFAHQNNDIAIVSYLNGHDVGGNNTPWNDWGSVSLPNPATQQPFYVTLPSPPTGWGTGSMGFYRGDGVQENIRPRPIGSYFSLAYGGRRFLRNAAWNGGSAIIVGSTGNGTSGTLLTLPSITLPPQGGMVLFCHVHHPISAVGDRPNPPDTSWATTMFSFDTYGPESAVGSVWWKIFPGGATGPQSITFPVSGVSRAGRLIGIPTFVP